MKGNAMDVTEIVARAITSANTDIRWPKDSAVAFLKALSASGFVIVPRIPTDAMLNAGWGTDNNGWDGPEACWTAMIDAALAERHRAQGRAAYAEQLERRAALAGFPPAGDESPAHGDVPEAMEAGA